jgi:type I restriction enzyme S subunit
LTNEGIIVLSDESGIVLTSRELEERYNTQMINNQNVPKLRFKEFSGEWEEKKLGEVCDCLDNIRKPLNDEERQKVQGSIPYWGANNIMGYINDYLFDETIVLLAEDGGNFNEYKTRPIANISHGKCWVNNHTHVLRGKINILINEFLYYSVVHKNITGYVSGGTRAKLTKGEMLKIEIALPTLKEQFKISNFLTSIDTKIDLATKQLDSTKQFKKALLQQMFV